MIVSWPHRDFFSSLVLDIVATALYQLGRRRTLTTTHEKGLESLESLESPSAFIRCSLIAVSRPPPPPPNYTQERNIKKCKLVYDAIAGSDGFYVCPTAPADQSCMNIPFTLADADLDKAFLAEAATEGLVTLKGHRSVGGMRASVYNAMPYEGCEKLAAFMKAFQAKNSA